ncbi:MAG TPA: condensation domain-containing protein, partial [Thermoanaerobaculia bacterium]|nr:condensation domain-containing protein [Thermoanaerobaculia bacterium]
RDQGATVFMTLLAAFQVLLWRYTGQADFVVGSVVANRERRETEGVIGLFVNNLALRADVSGNPTFHELLGRVRESNLRAYSHQDLPLDLLIDRLRLRTSADAAPFSQIRFVLESHAAEKTDFAGLSLGPFPVEGPPAARSDLALYMEQVGSDLMGTFIYNADLLSETTVLRLAARFQTLLEEVARKPDRRLGDIALERASEQEVPEGFVEELEEV